MAEASALGSYELLRPLGKGGMGEVFEARRKGGSGERLAIKTLPRAEIGNPGAVRRFLDEARLAVTLVHPNVVRTFEVVEDGERVGLVMELLDGLTAAQLCAQEELAPVEWTVAVAREVLLGLTHLHEAKDAEGKPRRLVHRDIKPSNLLVTRAGAVKIIDFGVSTLEGTDRTMTRTGTLRGSLPYCSPEVARHEALDGRSDLFSFGLVLHELLTGRRCFPQTSEAGILTAVLFSPVPPVRSLRPEVPAALEALVSSLVEKDAGRRPGSAREALAALEGCARASTEEVGAWVAKAEARAAASPETAGGLELGTLPVLAAAPRVVRRWTWPVRAGLGVVMAMGAAVWMGTRATPRVASAVPTVVAPVSVPFLVPARERVEVPPPTPVPSPPAHRRAHAVPPSKLRAPLGRGWLTVGVSSGWVNVKVEGRDLGPTPLFRQPLPEGHHLLVATRSDGSRKTLPFTIEPDKEKKIAIAW